MYDYTKGLFANVADLFMRSNITNATVAENQEENDKLLLDQEERIILLEVGE